VITQEGHPLRAGRNGGRAGQNVDDWRLVAALQSHEESRHDWEVETYVKLIAIAEVRQQILRPLIGLGDQDSVGILLVDQAAHLLEEFVRFGQILAIGPLALIEIGHSVGTKTVDTQIQPKTDDVEHLLMDDRVVVIQIGLAGVKAVPKVLPGDFVIGPVRRLHIQKDDTRFGVFLRRVAPYEVIPIGRVAVGPGGLEPGVLLGTMVHHQIGHDAKAARMGGIEERLEILNCAEIGMNAAIIGHIIPVIFQGRWVHRLHPDAIDTQRANIVQLGDSSLKIAVAVAVGIATSANVQLKKYYLLIPELIGHPRTPDRIH